jgi:putative DNA primase/helicase
VSQPIKDVSDWLAGGHTLEELRALVAGAPEQATIVKEQPRVVVEAEVMPAGDYRFSESEAARRFGDIIRGRAVFAADEGVWYYFDGKRWVKDLGGVWMLERSLDVSRAYAEDGIRHGSNDSQFQARMATAKTYNGLPGRKRLIELVKAETGLAILSAQFDADPWLFNCLNGTIDLRTGKLRDHNPADLLTKIAPVARDLAATRDRWDSFIDEVMPDAEARAHFKRVVGYFLTGEVYEHKLFFCFGTGANGKSVVFEVLLSFFGDYGTLAPVSLLTSKQVEQHPCDLNTLRGRRLAVFAETPQGQRWDESRVKALTGGDTITARGMRENYSTFPPTAKFAIAGNYRLRTNDLSEGFRRRFEEIPFEVTIPEERRDPKLAAKLRAELSGVLNWALEGCAEWQRSGLGRSAKVEAAGLAYFAENDRLAAFLTERCIFATSNRVSRAALRGAYEGWCSGEGEHPISPRNFGEQLRQRGVTEGSIRVAGTPVRGWHGVGLLDCGHVVTSKPQENGHVDTRSPESPVNGLEEVSREVNRESASTPDYVTTPADAPDPIAQLAHCLRAKPGTAATDADRHALAAHFSGLNGKSEETAQRLWSYWKADPAPTVPAFLARETRRRATS